MKRVIDVQAHLMPASFSAEVEALAEEQPAVRGMLDQIAQLDPVDMLRRVDDARVADMDAAGIDVQVLSIQPGAQTFPPRERAAELVALYNDELVAAARRYPGRFLVLCRLPFPYAEECVAELERLAPEPVVRGALIDAHSESFTVDEPRFEPVYAKLAELKMLAMLHPTIEGVPRHEYDYNNHIVIGMMASTSYAGLRLILGGMLDRVPDLDLVIPHLGGVIPYLTQRALDLARANTEHDLLYYLRNRVWLDSNSYWPPAFRCAAETVGGERIMLGTDYPLRGPLDLALRDLDEAGFDDATRAAILGGTASRWYGEEPRRAATSA